MLCLKLSLEYKLVPFKQTIESQILFQEISQPLFDIWVNIKCSNAKIIYDLV